MSPAIQIPVAAQSASPASITPATAKKHYHLPKPLLRLEFRDLSHAGSRAFISSTDPIQLLHNALAHVFTHLYHAPPSPSSDAGPQQDACTAGVHVRSPVPQTRSVTLVLRSMPGVAYTTGMEIDDQHKEIHLSLEYIQNIPSARRKAEIQGVVTHEMVHCLQWNGLGSAPGGLIEGVADWVRLRAGLDPPHWKREAKGNWDCGYQGTGWFLDWLEDRFGEGFVGRVNEGLRERKYVAEGFWRDLCGKGVEELWKEYGRWLDKKRDSDGSDESDGHGKHRPKKGKSREGTSAKPERHDARTSSSEDDGDGEDDKHWKHRPKNGKSRESRNAKPAGVNAQTSSSEDDGDDGDDGRGKHRPKKEDNREGRTAKLERDDSQTSSGEDDPIMVEKEDAMNERQPSDKGDMTPESAKDSLTYEEKQEIARRLPALPKSRLPEALRIIQEGMHRRMVIAGKLNVDINELSEGALQELLELVRSETAA